MSIYEFVQVVVGREERSDHGMELMDGLCGSEITTHLHCDLNALLNF